MEKRDLPGGKLLMCASRGSHLRQFHGPYVEWLAQHGWQVDTISQGKPELSGTRREWELEFSKKEFSIKNIQTVFLIRNLLRWEKYDVVVAHATLAGILTKLAAVLAGGPRFRLVLVCHGYLFREGGGWKSRLYTRGSESALSFGQSPQQLAEKLKEYPVISFDVFDTLILRPVDSPADVFDLVGARLGYLHFRQVRVQAEQKAREEKYRQYGTHEVTLAEIYTYLETYAMGPLAKRAMELEWQAEKALCFAHPYFLQLYQLLRQQGHQLVLVSDMYLPAAKIRELLERCGYAPPEKLYVSCEYGKSKAEGSLFQLVGQEWAGKKLLHIGDHPISDGEMARKSGLDSLCFPSVRQQGRSYRPEKMSSMVGSTYRGTVNAHLHSGLHIYSPQYEYGYTVGGLLAVGYCNYIHRHTEGMDKVLFLARDGELLFEIYQKLYPGAPCEYVYWSRRASLKLVCDRYRNDYFIRFVYDNLKKGRTLARLLEEMELRVLLEEVVSHSGISPQEEITSRNADLLVEALISLWEKVQKVYAPQREGARRYWQKVLQGCRRACAVDIGWVGSGAIYLRELVMEEWKIPCEITGLLAGTASAYVPGSEGNQGMFQTGVLDAYLFSQERDRALWCEHDPGKRHNVYLEMLFTSTAPSLREFDIKGEDGFVLDFCEPEPTDSQVIRELRQGVLAFAEEYRRRFSQFPELLRISGADAYAPFRLAAETGEPYWKLVFPNLKFQENLLP